MADAGAEGSGRVTRRRVFYIPGYDPIPPRRYRELYRREAAEQARISGHEITVEGRPGAAPGAGFGWDVTARIEGAGVSAAIEVLVWSDIVKRSMGQSIPATYGQLCRTAWIYLRSGALWRLMRLRKGPMIAALYPVAMLLGQLGVALALAALAAGAVLRAGGALPAVVAWPAVALAGVGLAWLVLFQLRRLDNRLYAYYLMHDYAFSASEDGAYPAALETQISAFGTRIAAALAEDWDEVLVVGHSSGAHLAVSILADLIRAGRVPATGAAAGPALGLLTLGQVVPMVSFLPGAGRLRGDLRFLSARDELAWIDVTAPGDGCAFALCDPVAVTGVAPPDQRWPLVISAAFSQTLSPERWRALKRRFFRLHFQYLCAFDRPGDYDYFRVTAGPRTLAARYAGRAPSKSRITRAVNRYTDCR